MFFRLVILGEPKLEIVFSNKIDILPNELSVSKENLWQVLNNLTSILIVDIIDQKILFANPNSIRELRIIEKDDKLIIPNVIGRKLSLPLSYGEKNQFNFIIDNDKQVLIEIKTSFVTWTDSPAYLLTLSSSLVN